VVDAKPLDVDGGGAGEVRQEGGQVGRLRAAERVDRGRCGVVSARRDGDDGRRMTAGRHAPDVDVGDVVVLDQRVVERVDA